MPFLVKYLQDIPQNCSECPCSIHITPKEVYCNARQKHFTVTDKRPAECGMIECNETKIEEKDITVLNKIKEELKVDKNKYSESGLIGTASGISRSMDVIDKYLADVEDSNDKTCKNCLFNYGKTFYYDYIICGYVKNKESIYKQENETCDKWVRKGVKECQR